MLSIRPQPIECLCTECRKDVSRGYLALCSTALDSHSFSLVQRRLSFRLTLLGLLQARLRVLLSRFAQAELAKEVLKCRLIGLWRELDLQRLEYRIDETCPEIAFDIMPCIELDLDDPPEEAARGRCIRLRRLGLCKFAYGRADHGQKKDLPEPHGPKTAMESGGFWLLAAISAAIASA